MTTPDTAELHHFEVALFILIHFRRAPGVLWPQHDHPVRRPDAGVEDMALLANSLSRYTDLPARTAAGNAAELARGTATRSGHLVVHQTAGRCFWVVHHDSGQGELPEFRYTLRCDEVLYVPPWRWCEVEHSRDARCVITRLGMSGAGPAALPSPPSAAADGW